jgi:hypothetical protein
MLSLDNHFNKSAKDSKIFSLGWKLRRMLLEKRNDYIAEIVSVVYFVTITIFMIRSHIFLKIYASAPKKFLKFFENTSDLLR